MQIARAKEAYALLASGVVGGLSIGYTPVEFSYNADTGTRLLKKVTLWEVSLVTFPANQAARVTVVKSQQEELIEWKTVRNTGQLIALDDAFVRAIAALNS